MPKATIGILEATIGILKATIKAFVQKSDKNDLEVVNLSDSFWQRDLILEHSFKVYNH